MPKVVAHATVLLLATAPAVAAPGGPHRAPPDEGHFYPARVRVTGIVISASGRSTEGFDVRLFRSFGGFGSGATVAVVDAKGSFEIPRVPPGAYGLVIEPHPSRPGQEGREFVDTMIDVKDDTTQTSSALVEQFKNEKVFWKQMEIAVPRLVTLVNDNRQSRFGALVTVSEAAKAAIAKLQ